MTQPLTYLSKTVLIAMSLALSLSLGCGDEGGAPSVNSSLLGVYQVESYQGSQTGCDILDDIEPPPLYVVLYSFLPNDNPDEPLLGGVFCGSVALCQQAAADAPEPQIGYSFTEGSDNAGWRGWAISSSGASNDQCRADVQAHLLTSATAGSIKIETRTFATVFDPILDGMAATCRNIDALAALGDDLPCQEMLVLEAARP